MKDAKRPGPPIHPNTWPLSLPYCQSRPWCPTMSPHSRQAFYTHTDSNMNAEPQASEQVTLSIKGITFQLLAPYTPGQPLGVAECGLLNKEWTQNVRLAFQQRVEQELSKAAGFGLSHAQIASLQLEFQHFADDFTFKALPQARNGDQLTRTKHAIARRIMEIRLNSDGISRAVYGEHRYESALARLMNNPEVIRQAQQQIAASREAADQIAGMQDATD